MGLTNHESLTCDVLVIGSGGAGLRSAIAAKLSDVDVLLVSKSKIGYSTNSYISKGVIAATGWGTADDDEKIHLEDTVKGGCFLNDQAMVAKMIGRACSEINFLRDCGVVFGSQEGKLLVSKAAGHRYPRHVFGENWTGSDLMLPLLRRAQRIGVRFGERVFITRLIADGDRICGAVGMMTDGRFLTIHAKTLILATGGYAQIYQNTNNMSGITGDGQALAYQLGIPLKDMEFVQFFPTATGKRGGRLILYEQFLAQPGVFLRSDHSDDIIKDTGVTDPTQVTRDSFSQLMVREANKGMSANQAIFIDLKGLSEENARKCAHILPSKWWRGQKVFRVSPTAHFCMGGIVTGHSGETEIKGLFAAGESTAGVHGANRIAGNALSEVFTMGSWVGQTAAERAKEIGEPQIPIGIYKEERSRLEGAFSSQGMSIKKCIVDLKALMWDKAGVIRQETGLSDALNRLQEPWPKAAVSSPVDLIKLLEFQNMRCVAEMVCRAALERTESRGSHFRSDWPEENNRNWLKNILLRKNSTGMAVTTEPVRLTDVEND